MNTSRPKKNYEKPKNEDRLIDALRVLRWRLIEGVNEIDKQIKYLEDIKRRT